MQTFDKKWPLFNQKCQSSKYEKFDLISDKNRLPHGKGRLWAAKQLQKDPRNVPCYEFLPVIGAISGNFKKGQLNGKVTIQYEDDATTLEGNFVKGTLHGKVRVFTREGLLLSVGLYRAGLPHGPFWFYSHFYDHYLFTR